MSDTGAKSGERKACDTCAKAKAKCIYSDAGDSDSRCERCTRLNKQCMPQAPPAKKKKIAKPNVSRGYQMEQKLDNIVNLLASRENGENSQVPGDVGNAPIPHVIGRPQWKKSADVGWRPDVSLTGGFGFNSERDSDLPTQPLKHVNLSYAEAEKLVDTWRPILAEHFPFAALYDGQSTQYLLVEMPFFATAIACAALYGDLPKQIEVAKSLIREIGERMLVSGEKSLDLLLGILVFLAWYHWHVFSNPQVSNLHHLCAALLVDLGLTRPPDRLYAQKWQMFGIHFIHGPSAHREMRSMAERRALAGCYYMSNVVWSTFKKMSSTPYSEHVEEAVAKLYTARELPSDELLVYLVKTQRLLENVELGLGLKDPSVDDSESASTIMLFISAFTSELRQLRSQMSPEIAQNIAIRLAGYETEALMYDIAFQHLNFLASRQQGDAHARSVKRLEYLKLTLASCKSFCDTLLVLQPGEYYRHAFDTWARMARVLMVVARISQTPDLKELNKELGTIIDFNSTAEAFAQKFDQADSSARAMGLPLGDNHLFKRWAWRLRTFIEVEAQAHHPDALRNLYNNASFPGDDPAVPMDITSSSSSAATPGQDDATNAEAIASAAEPWTEDVVNYGNAQPMCPVS